MSNANIYQRIHAVMNEIGTIAKNGKNTFHNYKYASEADYVQALRPLLEKHGLVVIPELVGSVEVKEQPTSKGDANYLTSLTVKFTLVNIDNPEEKAICIVPAQGQDKGDKGVYKAMTGAKKYWAALTFMVATGDDPEKDDVKGARKAVTKGKKFSALTDDDEF